MMNYKLVAIDLDGTLLNLENNIPFDTHKIINDLCDKEVKIVLSSGRLRNSMQFYHDLLGVKQPIITSNGAQIILEDKEVFSKTMDLDDVKLIKNITLGHDPKAYIHIYSEGLFLANKPLYEYLEYDRFNRNLPEQYRLSYGLLNENTEKDLHQRNIYKVCIVCDTHEHLTKVRQEIEKVDKFEITSTHACNIEVNVKNVSKGNALKWLANELDIDLNECIAIGDGWNDISMIEMAGLGVAMGNACDDLKHKADIVLDETNRMGAVGLFLDRVFNQ